jgi:hypothetical protein
MNSFSRLSVWPSLILALATAIVGAGCPSQRSTAAKRVELRRIGGELIQLVPAENQPEYCLVFSLSERGVIRQLTMSRDNHSLRCEAGKPIGRTYRIPREEGAVKLRILLSDQRLSGRSVAEQLDELRDKPNWSAMDLRMPGQVYVETLDFSPEEEVEAPAVGGRIESGGGFDPRAIPDAGSQAEGEAAAPSDAGR